MHSAAHPREPTTAAPVISWEECACLLCGSATHAPLLEAADPLGTLRFLIVKCARCGLCFTNPRPDAVSIKSFYPADYRCHQWNPDAKRQRGDDRAPRWISSVIPAPALGASRPRLLDVGCGAGDFLQRMQQRGWSVAGIDSSEAAVARVRQRGLDACVGTLPNSRWTDSCFELITMWQSLEHVHQPLDALRAAYRLLTTGGKLIVTTPNFESFAARWFGSAWYGLDLPRHLTHFTPETLRMMLGQAGFQDVELRQERRSSWIRHSAALAPRYGLLTPLLRTRVGSGLAGCWGLLTGQADSLIAVAVRA